MKVRHCFAAHADELRPRARTHAHPGRARGLSSWRKNVSPFTAEPVFFLLFFYALLGVRRIFSKCDTSEDRSPFPRNDNGEVRATKETEGLARARVSLCAPGAMWDCGRRCRAALRSESKQKGGAGGGWGIGLQRRETQVQ